MQDIPETRAGPPAQDGRPIWRRWLSHDAHPTVQFVKYGICGGIATVVDVTVFFLLAWKVFPALTENDPLVRWLGIGGPFAAENVRAMHFVWDRILTFLVSNLTAYVTNVLWVFRRGRHHWIVEIGLFYAVSGISMVVGTTIGWALIQYGGFATSIAFLCNMVASLLINYVCRKYLIFHG